eukprot:1190010-Prorocentrum_minimum.AAC.6
MFYNQPSVGGEGWYVCSAPQRPAPSLNPPLPPGGRLPYKGGFNGDPDDPPPSPPQLPRSALGGFMEPSHSSCSENVLGDPDTPNNPHLCYIMYVCEYHKCDAFAFS